MLRVVVMLVVWVLASTGASAQFSLVSSGRRDSLQFQTVRARLRRLPPAGSMPNRNGSRV